MKLCYLVYREDNVMVYESQVLEYLRSIKDKNLFESIELIVFRHQDNFSKKKKVEDRIHKYIDKCKTFCTLPVLSILQLNINASRLRTYVTKTYKHNDYIAVICRGDLAAYVGVKAFHDFGNSRVLYDNRGLAYEESVMSHHDSFIYSLNRNVKLKALNFVKNHVDMYNFVTNAMRAFLLRNYGYNSNIPFTIIPTLCRIEKRDKDMQNVIERREGITANDFVVSYVGSTAAWQSTHHLVKIIKLIGEKYLNAKFIILSNGAIQELDDLDSSLKNRIVIKSVPHNEMKYYLHMTDVGIIIRDNNIVNQVAAPTKLAEYLISGITVLYSGNIGIIDDIVKISDNSNVICMDNDSKWLEKIDPITKPIKKVDSNIIDYFDMNKRQEETYKMIIRAFEKPKIE